MVNLIRVVRMTFQEEKVPTFLENFNQVSAKIRGFDGCQHLELWQDPKDPTIFMTYSHWESEQALEKYRKSVLFRETWAKTKVLFADRPLAFSATPQQLISAQAKKELSSG